MFEPIEALEPRRLLNARLTSTGTLLVFGTARNDQIVFVDAGDVFTVQVNGRKTILPYDSVRRITIEGRRGDDTVIVGHQQTVVVRIKAGPGDDTIGGGSGDDILFGDSGDDLIGGGAGNDAIDGGAGGDDINGSAGVDIVDYTQRTAAVVVTRGDDAANDGEFTEGDNVRGDVEVVYGTAFDDSLVSSTGADGELHGGRGNDTLIGGSGVDLLDGGPGLDLLDGNAGFDGFRARDGERDTIFFGSDDGDGDLDIFIDELPELD